MINIQSNHRKQTNSKDTNIKIRNTNKIRINKTITLIIKQANKHTQLTHNNTNDKTHNIKPIIIISINNKQNNICNNNITIIRINIHKRNKQIRNIIIKTTKYNKTHSA